MNTQTHTHKTLTRKHIHTSLPESLFLAYKLQGVLNYCFDEVAKMSKTNKKDYANYFDAEKAVASMDTTKYIRVMMNTI